MLPTIDYQETAGGFDHRLWWGLSNGSDCRHGPIENAYVRGLDPLT